MINESSNVKPKQTRGRKSILSTECKELIKCIELKSHHFKYSEEFAEQLASFAKSHLEDSNKQFKLEWKKWTELNSIDIQTEIAKMKEAGYTGSVEDKMYFSARYYYRKKAMKNENEDVVSVEESSSRKKYESIDKQILSQMSEHIILQIRSAVTESSDGSDKIVCDTTPSISFANYCERYGVSCGDLHIKKYYKNLYWRIKNKTKNKVIAKL